MTHFSDEQLAELKNVTPPAGLDARLIYAVRRERRRQRALYYLLEAGLAATAAAAFVAGRLFLSDLSASPLADLLRLAWTDSRSVLNSFGDWLLALLESAPVGSLSLTLGAVFICVLLLDKIVGHSRIQLKQTRRAM